VPGLKSGDIDIDIISNTLTINREDKAKELNPKTIEIKAKGEK
jgi:HSP20 family molecular chaperone IbpA